MIMQAIIPMVWPVRILIEENKYFLCRGGAKVNVIVTSSKIFKASNTFTCGEISYFVSLQVKISAKATFVATALSQDGLG